MNVYNLMYIESLEKRRLGMHNYTLDERIDLFVHCSCLLDKTLKINELKDGIVLLTNNRDAITKSLCRIGYSELKVLEIPFTLDVPRGIEFYSAHFKIDVFKYLSNQPETEYSILLDSDVVCMKKPNDEFWAVVEEGLPMLYYLPRYGGQKKLRDMQSIANEIKWAQWVGGEFIGGTASFYRELYNHSMEIKDKYWQVINDGLFHVGDEMLISIAIAKVRNTTNKHIVDAGNMGFIYRYWSI